MAYLRQSVPVAAFVAMLLEKKAITTGSLSPYRVSNEIMAELEAAGETGISMKLVSVSPTIGGGNWFGEGEQKGQSAYIGNFNVHLQHGTNTTFASLSVADFISFATSPDATVICKRVNPVNKAGEPLKNKQGELIWNIVAVKPITVDLDSQAHKDALNSFTKWVEKAPATIPAPIVGVQ